MQPNHTICADSLTTLAKVPEHLFDAVITDPPYGLSTLPTSVVKRTITRWQSGDHSYIPKRGKGFMGAGWDRFVPPPALWSQVARVTKPGGMVAAFAGARTLDLMMLSMKTGGLTILGVCEWVNAQGFPKSHRVDKEIDKILGAERTLRVDERWRERYPNGAGGNLKAGTSAHLYEQAQRREGLRLTSDPVTPQAKQWAGWGTSLKPAHEPIIIATNAITGKDTALPHFLYHPKALTKERPEYLQDGQLIQHPTTKPLGLMKWLIEQLTAPQDWVLDPFAGSGTTGQACVETGRKYTLIENEEAYIRLIDQRLSTSKGATTP